MGTAAGGPVRRPAHCSRTVAVALTRTIVAEVVRGGRVLDTSIIPTLLSGFWSSVFWRNSTLTTRIPGIDMVVSSSLKGTRV